jgi:hypothetical protein
MSTSVSLIVDAAITRVDALDAIARAARSVVTDRGASTARILLADGAIVTVDIPKFGEAPPLAIDVTSADRESARIAADELLFDLSTATDWPIHRDY